MLELIKINRGKEELVFRGERREVNARLRLLRNSDKKAKFVIRETESNEKFKKTRKDWGHD